MLEALQAGHIRLLRVAWLRAQPEGYRLERRQKLEEREQNGETPLPDELRPGVVVLHNNHIRENKHKRNRFRRIGMWNLSGCECSRTAAVAGCLNPSSMEGGAPASSLTDGRL